MSGLSSLFGTGGQVAPSGRPLRFGLLVTQALLACFLLWLYPGDVVRYVRAQGAAVAVMTEVPSLPLALLGSLVALGFTATLLLVALRKQDGAWRPRRLLLASALFLLFLDFAVLSFRRSAISAERRLLLAVTTLTDEADANAAVESVLREPQLLQSFLGDVGPVPLFVEGQQVPAWKVEVRERCSGPALEPGAATPGTLIYCIAADRQRAWVTLVGAALGQTFGPPAIVSAEGDWVGVVRALEPPAERDGPPVWGEPTPDEEP
jgi:hypothetical protein